MQVANFLYMERKYFLLNKYITLKLKKWMFCLS